MIINPMDPRFRVSNAPAQLPRKETISGEYCTLDLVNWETDAENLYLNLKDPDLWDYLPLAAPDTYQKMRDFFQALDLHFYVVRRHGQGDCLGLIGYLNPEMENQSTEVYLLFSKKIQKTTITSEACYLIFRYAFESLGYNRLMWKAHTNNLKSCYTASRLGLKFQGILRDHWVTKGHYRTSKYYSMLRRQWEPIKSEFERWLDSSNFSGKGEEISKLGLKGIRERLDKQES